jgi:hypothetical protein
MSCRVGLKLVVSICLPKHIDTHSKKSVDFHEDFSLEFDTNDDAFSIEQIVVKAQEIVNNSSDDKHQRKIAMIPYNENCYFWFCPADKSFDADYYDCNGCKYNDLVVFQDNLSVDQILNCAKVITDPTDFKFKTSDLLENIYEENKPANMAPEKWLKRASLLRAIHERGIVYTPGQTTVKQIKKLLQV